MTSTGIDTDFRWRTPIEGLTLQGGVTYANTRYGDFVPGSGVPALLPGRRVAFAPLVSGNVQVTYDVDISETMTLHANVSYRYSGGYSAGQDLLPVKYQPSYSVVNARLGIGGIDDKWSVELWGANLTDETVSQVVFDPAFDGAAAQSVELARSAVPRVVAVSCNPQTFARDAAVLIEGGYALTRVTPVDQFLYSPHVELVAEFLKD